MRESFARLLARHATQADARRAMASDQGYDPALWRQIADMGLTGLIVDTEYGGIGAGPVELECIMEEAGAALLTAPFLSSAVLAAGLLSFAADDAAKARLLPGIADGTRIATVALTGGAGSWTMDGVSVTAVAHGNTARLHGVASYVTSGAQADTLLVVARTDTGVAAFQVNPVGAGVTITPLKGFDSTTRLAHIAFDAAEALPIAGADEVAIERTLDLARVALAGEQAGAARYVFDTTIAYVKTRVQFGRPVGGFQAIKHMAADLLIEVESAISAARHAAQALAAAAPDAETLINLAAFACADAFSLVAASSIQMHGGIGFTWDHPAHLYLRRARADAQLFGTSAMYRDRYITALERAA